MPVTLKLTIIKRNNPIIKQRRMIFNNMRNNGKRECIVKIIVHNMTRDEKSCNLITISICRVFDLIGEIIQCVFDFNHKENTLIQFKIHFVQLIVIFNVFYTVMMQIYDFIFQVVKHHLMEKDQV